MLIFLAVLALLVAALLVLRKTHPVLHTPFGTLYLEARAARAAGLNPEYSKFFYLSWLLIVLVVLGYWAGDSRNPYYTWVFEGKYFLYVSIGGVLLGLYAYLRDTNRAPGD